MMRGLRSRLHSAAPLTHASTRGARFARSWLGGFNLLPYRQRNARLARRQRLLEWVGAALAGFAAVLALAGWQVFERARLDVERASIEQSLTQLTMPLAEHASLLRAQDEHRKGVARAMNLSEPLAHLRDLLNALSFEPGDGVVLQRLRQREYETELLATSRGYLASAEWLKRLSAIRGVKGAQVSDLHRSAPRSGAVAAASVTGPIEFGAHLRWGDPPKKTGHTSAQAAQRPMKSEQSGGAK
ncbi:type IV pilus assembly protein PilN [Paraburkholderia sp. BL23I1N1]|uniref:fimbrial assembly protein n=1 Tax=Paraburkholderia sp. BL23I1N1 TaxID=1938802 RepID=UPI000E735942|nr:fimbrial assembly protein [Paraburkholderia sp. BL23I1N1]RKE34095.1 type IV pilus assembly protein PilN [Paraburkholderia sp. BL23I1N1]